MNRYKHHIRIIVEDFFSSISMMDIPIENADLLETKFSLSISSTYCHIIHIAESTSISFTCMMAWRTYSAESRGRLVMRADSVDSLNDSTCSDCCTLESALIMISISGQFPHSRSIWVFRSKLFFLKRYSS